MNAGRLGGPRPLRVLLKVAVYAGLLFGLHRLAGSFGAAYTRAIADATGGDATRALTAFVGYLALGVTFGLVTAWDTTRLLGSLSDRLFLGGGRVLTLDARPRQAEKLRRAGKPLEAIGLLREYLTDQRRDWLSAARIAEIYEHDLQKPLAAALEYEELLQRRLPSTARPWLLLRLANLQLALRREDAAVALFRRILDEFPESNAVVKARRRLGIHAEILQQAAVHSSADRRACL